MEKMNKEMTKSDSPKKIVVIGMGTGGLYASRGATSFDRRVEITIIEKRDYDMFSPCGLPYAIEGKVPSFDDLKHSVPTTRRLKKLTSHEALSIDTEGKRLEVKNLESGEVFWLDYDSLIVSTGSEPIILPIPGAHELLGKGVHVVTNPEEAEALREARDSVRPQGAGARGLRDQEEPSTVPAEP